MCGEQGIEVWRGSLTAEWLGSVEKKKTAGGRLNQGRREISPDDACMTNYAE